MTPKSDVDAVWDEIAAAYHWGDGFSDARSALRRVVEERDRLREAIRKHRDQRADDRCWLDDLELYEALEEPVPADVSCVGDRKEMLANCERYVSLRCSDGGDWTSYADLKKQVTEMGEELAKWKNARKLLWDAVYVMDGQPIKDMGIVSAIYEFLEKNP